MGQTKDIPRTPGARRIKAWVAEGEHLCQDFKFAVSDPRKIARSISAFANHSGGRLLIGVKDNGAIAGVRNEEDVYVVDTAAVSFCTPGVEVDFHAYSVDSGITVIVASIPAAAVPPVYVRENGGELRAYYRVADENIAAHPLMVEAWEHRALGRALLLDQRHARMLDIVRQYGSMQADTRSLALALGCAEDTARSLAVELAAAGAITFVHKQSGFHITIPEQGHSY